MLILLRMERLLAPNSSVWVWMILALQCRLLIHYSLTHISETIAIGLSQLHTTVSDKE